MTTGDLFAGMAFDPGQYRPSLTQARKLVAGVEALAGATDSFYRDCSAVARKARQLRAWSVERAVLWLRDPESFERHGFYACHITAERIANNWLRRLEQDA